MQRLSAGTVNPPNKVIRRLNTISATCTTTAMVCRETESRPTAYSSRLPLRATNMQSGRLSVTGRAFQSTRVPAYGAFNKPHVFLASNLEQRGMSVDAIRRFRSRPGCLCEGDFSTPIDFNAGGHRGRRLHRRVVKT
jgi:hypothetical protein